MTQPTSRLSPPSPSERSKPAKGVGPVSRPPIPSPNLAAVFVDEDEWMAWAERAAVREFDGGLSRAAAERLAWAEVLAARKARLGVVQPGRKAG